MLIPFPPEGREQDFSSLHQALADARREAELWRMAYERKPDLLTVRIRRRIAEWIGGHWNIGPVTIYGRNAMHFAVNIRTRWGYVCFKPPTRCFGYWWPWYFYISPNATPWAATFKVGHA